MELKMVGLGARGRSLALLGSALVISACGGALSPAAVAPGAAAPAAAGRPGSASSSSGSVPTGQTRPGDRANAGGRGLVRAVDASVKGTQASLANSQVLREWRFSGGGLVDTRFEDLATQPPGKWVTSRTPSNDFAITINEVPFTSQNFAVVDASARAAPADPSRPQDQNAGAQQIVFKLQLLAPGPAAVEVDRTFTLYPDSPTIEVATQLINNTPAPLRVGRYSLDELTTKAAGAIEVQAYNGGTDWRDDYRHVVTETSAPSDDEGEVLRFDDGKANGFFFVSQRRGGLMSRAGRDAGGRTWIGVDNARDALDLGPLASSPPNYNRLGNPAYPAPVRERNVAPLGSLELGTAYTGVYHGGAQQAAAAFASDFFMHAMPTFARTVGQNSFHPWGHGCLFDDSKLPAGCPSLRQDVLAAKALGLESFMLDDQWQGPSSGDWHFDLSRFPDPTGAKAPDGESIPDFVSFVRAQGLNLGLWMSPLEFNGNSQTYKQHPDWVCTPIGDATAQIKDDAGLGVWDVTNSGFRTYLKGVVDRLISDYAVAEFKFDFVTWVDCPPHDYLDYEDAFAALVRDLEMSHPNVTFETDETNDQRAWPFESAALGPSWFDNDHTHGSDVAQKQLHDLWSAAPWLATWSMGFGVYDGTLAAPYSAGFLMPAAILSHFTFWKDLTKLSPGDAAETTWWLNWYKQNRAAITGFTYEDTKADPIDGKSWLALQPWNGTGGYLFVFSQASGGTQAIALQGVSPTAQYHLTDVRTGQIVGAFSGASLSQGLSLTLPAHAAQVIAVTPG